MCLDEGDCLRARLPEECSLCSPRRPPSAEAFACGNVRASQTTRPRGCQLADGGPMLPHILLENDLNDSGKIRSCADLLRIISGEIPVSLFLIIYGFYASALLA